MSDNRQERNDRWQKRFDDADLTRRILDRTSGRACTRAEDLLGATWDAAHETEDNELLDGHLESCAGCRELATILDRLQPALPGLAEREPGPAFTAGVLARTSRLQPAPGISAAPTPGRIDRLAQRLVDRARGAWNRPRFALEAAWTAAALTALLVWSPLAPSDAPDQATGVIRAGAGATPELIAQVDRLIDSVKMAGHEVLGPRFDRLEQDANEFQADLTGRIAKVKQGGRALWQRLTGDDTQHDSD